MSEPLVIDGAQGEGGGQILRTSLALAAVTGRAVRITDIRAGRRNPGLAAQHLVACKAVAAICDGDLRDAKLHSREVELHPRALTGGGFFFDVSKECPSAGSTTLIAQAILPALLFSPQPSSVTLRGGTEVPWSPVFAYLSGVFAPQVQAMGAELGLTRLRPGWYPVGGGEMRATVAPLSQPLLPLDLTSRGELQELATYSLCSKRLPEHIVPRQCEGARQALGSWSEQHSICYEAHLESSCPGTTCLAVALFEHGAGGASELGRTGTPAERVGAEAGMRLREFLSSAATVDAHLADQLLVYAALAAGTTTFVTTEATGHLRTNALVIERMLGVPTEITHSAEGVRVSLTGLGLAPPSR
jgi:RNA 3'-phosphate cyclase